MSAVRACQTLSGENFRLFPPASARALRRPERRFAAAARTGHRAGQPAAPRKGRTSSNYLRSLLACCTARARDPTIAEGGSWRTTEIRHRQP